MAPHIAAPHLNQSVLTMLVNESKSTNACAEFAKTFKPDICQVPEILAYALTNVRVDVIDNVIDLYGLTQADAEAVLGMFEILSLCVGYLVETYIEPASSLTSSILELRSIKRQRFTKRGSTTKVSSQQN